MHLSSAILLCYIDDPVTKKRQPRNYLETLERRVAYLEDILKQHHPDLADDHLFSGDVRQPYDRSNPASFTQVINDSHDDRTDMVASGNEHSGIDDLASKVGLLSLNAAGAEPHYLGSSSTFAFSRLIEVSLRQVPLDTPRNFNPVASSSYWPPVLQSPCALPDHDTAMKLSDAYFQNVHLQYPFLHEPTFREWEAALTGPAVSAELVPVASFFVFMLPLDIEDSCITSTGINGRPRDSLSDPPTSLTKAMHTFRMRRILGCIHASVYSDITASSTAQQAHRAHIKALRTELEDWRALTPPVVPQSGQTLSLFATPDWFDLEYSYSILQLYRAQLVDARGDRSDEVFIDCIKAAECICHGYRRQFLSKPTNCTWAAVHELFLAGLTYLHCLWASPTVRNANSHSQVRSTCTDCTIVLVLMAERWDAAATFRDVFEALASHTMSMMDDKAQGKWTMSKDSSLLGGTSTEDLSQWRLEIATEGVSEGLDGLLASFMSESPPCEYDTPQSY
ncbi:hypothetical protein N0V90_002414 [Kalmusia sp. IMI 367209]|nr:hypothetical protein N0V90_002414 [Kalmusia sp. IMI 367209]